MHHARGEKQKLWKEKPETLNALRTNFRGVPTVCLLCTTMRKVFVSCDLYYLHYSDAICRLMMRALCVHYTRKRCLCFALKRPNACACEQPNYNTPFLREDVRLTSYSLIVLLSSCYLACVALRCGERFSLGR